jgi:hypothetical protein
MARPTIAKSNKITMERHLAIRLNGPVAVSPATNDSVVPERTLIVAENAQPDPDSKPPVGALIALLVVVVLVLGGWFLTHQLSSAAGLQDCVASGRTNCAPITTTGR